MNLHNHLPFPLVNPLANPLVKAVRSPLLFRGGGGGVTPTYWDTDAVNATYAELSGDNNEIVTCHTTVGYDWNQRGLMGKSTGKWMFEIKIVGTGGSNQYTDVGLVHAALANSGAPGQYSGGGWGGVLNTRFYYNAQSTAPVEGWTNPPETSYYSLFVDVDAGKIYLAVNGVFHGIVTANVPNPDTGANPQITEAVVMPTAAVYPAVSMLYATQSAELRLVDDDFQYSRASLNGGDFAAWGSAL